MPLPAPLAFVWNQLRRLVITPFDPEPGFDGFLERAQTESNDRAQVTVAVLSGREAERLFGVPINRRGIQPVFVRVENRSADGLRLQVVSLDPSYFTPLEAASLCHFSIVRRLSTFGIIGWLFVPMVLFLVPLKLLTAWLNNARMDDFFRDRGFRLTPIEPGARAEGFIFTTLDAGTKAVNADYELVGRPAVAGGLVIVYCGEGDAIVAADAATGKKVWSQPLGDVPIGPAVAIPSGLLVASKSNRVVLLDPETGTLRAERTLPGWIVDVIPLSGTDGRPAGRIAALTRDGVVTLLNAADLGPEGTRQLDGRPGYDRAAGFMRVKAFPTAWPGPVGSGGEADELDAELEDSMADRAECLLADDEEGYAWIIPLSRLMEKP